MPQPRPTTVFVGSAPQDDAYHQRLLVQLAGLNRSGRLALRDIHQLEPGTHWRQELGAMIDACDIALLLLSADLLASDLYNDLLLPRLLRRREFGGLRLLLVLVSPCYWQQSPLHAMKVFPEDQMPIASRPRAGQDQAWTELALLLDRLAGGTAPPQTPLTLSALARLDLDELKQRLTAYRARIAGNAHDAEALLGLALCSLRLRHYEPAAESLRRYLELQPEDANAHYYRGIALLQGRRPRSLKLPEVREVERCLESAIRLHDKNSQSLYLLAAVRQDYYLTNGLISPPPSVEELLRSARSGTIDPQELGQLLQCVTLPDDALKAAIQAHTRF